MNKKFSTITLEQYFSGYRWAAKEDTLENLKCYVCEKSLKISDLEKVIITEIDKKYFALCSEICFNMFILQNI